MVKIAQGDVFWYDFADPRGSEPGFERPVVIIQGNRANRTSLETAVVVCLTTTMSAAAMPGNVVLPKHVTGLDDDTVANVTQIATVDRDFLRDQARRLPASKIAEIMRGVDRTLGRDD